MRNAFIGLAALAAATSANAGVVTFENYAVGQSVGGAIAGTPYPFLFVGNFPGPLPKIEFSDQPGIGNYLRVDADPFRVAPNGNGVYDYATLFVGRFRVDPDTRYRPRVISFDVLAPFADTVVVDTPGRAVLTPLPVGQWTTYTLVRPLEGSSFVKIRGTAFIDNIVFEDAFEVVPEPSTWAMIIIGFGLLGAAARRARPRPALA